MRIGGLEGLAGRFETARATIARARAIMDDLGLHHQRAHSTDVAVLVEILAEDYEAAEREARHAYAVLAEMGDRDLPGQRGAPDRGGSRAPGTHRRSRGMARRPPTRSTTPRTIQTRSSSRHGLLARRGDLDEAIELTRADTRPSPWAAGRAIRRRAASRSPSSSCVAGRYDEATRAAEECLHRYEAKGIVPLIQKTNALLAEIQVRGSAASAS